MEIEFNTGPVGQSDPAKPVQRLSASKPAREESAPFPNSAALEDKLKDIPLTRPERLHRAKTLVSNLKYPPDDVLVGIANLLAMNIK